jgi:hypothetical protein
VNKIDDDSGACKLTQEETGDVTGGGDDSLASGDGEDEIPEARRPVTLGHRLVLQWRLPAMRE